MAQTGPYNDGQQELTGPDGGDGGGQSWVKGALRWAGETLLAGNPRAGGADPCCPPGYNPSGAWPRNALQGGAPPDYRTRGSPMEDPSPSGTGRLKDDFCDCIPIHVGGRWWMLGGIDGGNVVLGPPADLDAALWVEVDPASGRPLSVPGFGAVTSSPASGGDSSSSSAGGIPTSSAGPGEGGRDNGTYTVEPERSSLGILVALGLLGALLMAGR